MNIFHNFFVDMKLFWEWPNSHFNIDQKWREKIETTLFCFAYNNWPCHVPSDIVTLIIHHWGSAIKIMNNKCHTTQNGREDAPRPSKRQRRD